MTASGAISALLIGMIAGIALGSWLMSRRGE